MFQVDNCVLFFLENYRKSNTFNYTDISWHQIGPKGHRGQISLSNLDLPHGLSVCLEYLFQRSDPIAVCQR